MRSPCLLAAAAAALLAACSDFSLPAHTDAPPAITALTTLGSPNPADAAAPVEALAGEQLAITGSGFGADPTAVDVSVGERPARLRDATDTRVVFELPELALAGDYDLTVSTRTGRATRAGALRYRGDGAPDGERGEDLRTRTSIYGLVPVELPDALPPLGNAEGMLRSLVFGIGPSDSAVLFIGSLGGGFRSVPMGVIPRTAAARLVTGNVEVFAADGFGRLGKGSYEGGSGSATGVPVKVSAVPLAAGRCRVAPELHFTRGGGSLVAFWTELGAGNNDVGSSWARTARPDTLDWATSAAKLPAPVAAAVPSVDGASMYVVTAQSGGAAPQVLRYTASTGALAPVTLAGKTVPELLLSAACGKQVTLRTIAAAKFGTAERLALSYAVDGGADEVAELDDTGVVSRGMFGVPITALSYARVGGDTVLLAAAGNALDRLTRTPDSIGLATGTCTTVASTLRVTGSLAVGDALETHLPPNGIAVVPDGPDESRVMVLDGAGDVLLAFPATMTSSGRMFRAAPYGPLSVWPSPAGGSLLLAEHVASGISAEIDTASTLFVSEVEAAGGSTWLGGNSYGRGVGLGPDAIAVTGEALFPPAGASKDTSIDAVTKLTPACGQVDVDVRDLVRGPSVYASHPARNGALGPRRGSDVSTSPVVGWGLFGKLVTLTADCLGRPGGTCDVEPRYSLPWQPPAREVVDVVPNATGDAFAVRMLDLSKCGACPIPGMATCTRQACAVVSGVGLVTAAGAVEVALPSIPVALTADRSGGFVVSVARCERASGGGCVGAAEKSVPPVSPSSGALYALGADGKLALLAVGDALGGAVRETPNGAELWVAGRSGNQRLLLTRLALSRTLDGALDQAPSLALLGRTLLGVSLPSPEAFAPSGIAFTPDGSRGFVSVPDEAAIATFE